MNEPRILASIATYPELIQALRSWAFELGTTYDAIDQVAGWEGRYVAKLLSPRPVKTFGQISLGLVLAALGLRLQVAVDEAALAKVRHRLTPSQWPTKRRAKQRQKIMEAAAAVEQDADAQRRALMSELGRQSHAARMARTTPEERQHQASVAAKARWKAARRRLREAAGARLRDRSMHAGVDARRPDH
jgi:hypothetical protein